MSRKRFPIVAAALAAGFGLTAQSFGGIITPAVVLPDGPVSDDSTPTNLVTYATQTLSSDPAAAATSPNGSVVGAGDPYVVGTLGYLTTGSVAVTTAFASTGTPPTFYGQNDPISNPNTYVDGFNHVHNATIASENTSGLVAVFENREASNDTAVDPSGQGPLGINSYLYNPANGSFATLGLATFGASYSSGFYSNVTYPTTTVGTYYNSKVVDLDSNGDAAGITTRLFTGNGSNTLNPTTVGGTSGAGLGVSAWYYNGSTTTEVGETSGAYTYVRTVASTINGGGTGTVYSNTVVGTRGGYVAGTASVFDGDTAGVVHGTDGWVYNTATGSPSTVTALGLYQSGLSATVGSNTYTYSYNVTVNSVVYQNRSTTIKALNSVGQVAGTSLYYASSAGSSLGTDAWLYTPPTGSGSGTYTLLGYTSGLFTETSGSSTGSRTSNVTFLNNAGDVTGTSLEYPNGTSSLPALIAWVTPSGGSTTKVVYTGSVPSGVSGTYATTIGSYSYSASPPSVVTELTNSGLVGGYNNRFTSATNTTVLGQDAWIYNESTTGYSELEPTPNLLPGFTNYFSDSITYLAENGDAVGYFQLASGGPQYGFLYTPTGGFDDLTYDPNLTAMLGGSNSFATILNAYSIDPTGTTIYAYAGNASGTATGLAIITVPEPTSITVLAATGAMVSLLRRGRRRY